MRAVLDLTLWLAAASPAVIVAAAAALRWRRIRAEARRFARQGRLPDEGDQ